MGAWVCLFAWGGGRAPDRSPPLPATQLCRCAESPREHSTRRAPALKTWLSSLAAFAPAFHLFIATNM